MERKPLISELQGKTYVFPDIHKTYEVYLSGTHNGIYSMAIMLETPMQQLKQQLEQMGGKYYIGADNVIFATRKEAEYVQKYITGIAIALKLQGKGKWLG
jgi:hypothetical protein